MTLVTDFKIPGVSTTVFRRVVAGASAAYSLDGSVPSIERIRYFCGTPGKTISIVIASQEFKDTMERRGYSWESAKLSPEQEFAVGIITDPTRRGDMSQKLKAAGVSYSQYRAWMKDPHFKEFISQVGEKMLGEHIQDVHTSVMNRATNGDINAAKLVYELTGRYDPAKQQVTDLQAIVALLLEVITRHVRDTSVLAAISSDVELVMSGKIPEALTSFSIADDNVVDAEVLDPADANDSPTMQPPVGHLKEEPPVGLFNF
jgi:hypothetical protein